MFDLSFDEACEQLREEYPDAWKDVDKQLELLEEEAKKSEVVYYPS